MKNTLVIAIFTVMSLSCTAQNGSNRKLIESFITKIDSTKGDISISFFRENNFLYLSDEYEASVDKTDVDSMYSIVIKRVYNSLQCENDLEILTLEESQIENGYSEILHIPEDYDNEIYVLYCKEDILLHFLIRNDKIFSFITMRKGRTRIFMTF